MCIVRFIRTCGLLILLSGGLWNAAPLRAAEVPSSRQSFTEGSQAFAQANYLLALSHFQAARTAGLDTMAVNYNIAVCQYKLGDHSQAAASFRLLVQRFPAMRGLAQYNLGLIALKGKDSQTARGHFESARIDGQDEKVTRLANLQLSRLPKRVMARFKTYHLLDLRTGYDDNVALLTDTNLPAGSMTDSLFAEVFALIGTELTTLPNFRFDASVYSARYPDADGFDQNSFRVGSVYRWVLSNTWNIEVGPYLTYTTLDGDSFSQGPGASVRVNRQLNRHWRVSTELGHDEIDAGDARFAFVEGSRDRLRLTLDYVGDAMRGTLGYTIERNDRVDPGVSPDRWRVRGRLRYDFDQRWQAHFEAAVHSSAYNDLVPERNEDFSEIIAGIARSLGRWQVSLQIQYSENDSDVSGFSYERTRAVLGLAGSF